MNILGKKFVASCEVQHTQFYNPAIPLQCGKTKHAHKSNSVSVHFLNSPVHNTPKLEITQMFITDEGINKSVIYSTNELLQN